MSAHLVVVKRWKVEDGMSFKEVKHVPVWVQLYGLELKYWNPKSLSRIGSTLGRPIMADAATITKERVAYARLLIDVEI